MAQSRDRSFFIGIVVASSILLVGALWSFRDHVSSCSALLLSTIDKNECNGGNVQFNRRHDPQEKTFYDDPQLGYAIDSKPIKNWDEKRKEWLKHHPSFAANAKDRMLILTGSKPSPCENPTGDHLLMRCFKNKVDYCRIHGYDIFYNNAVLQPKMDFCWAKIPMVRAAMMAHPEVEWIWWIDSDAIFTDMDFKVPFDRYKNHNLVVVGSPDKIYKKKTWLSINAGVFLIRNCQWSMDLLDVWASMGPISPNFEQWGETFSSTLTERTYVISDDQSALVYLLLTQKEKWGEKIFLENVLPLNGYWLQEVGRFENITENYVEIEKRVSVLRRRHAELVSESYGAIWEPYLVDGHYKEGMLGWRRPFITHFAGCQPCNGKHNPMYEGDSCWVGMERALNFADNQVLRNFGFVHPDLANGSYVSPLPFDFPSDDLGLDGLD